MLPTLTVNGNYNRKGASKTSGDGLVTALANNGLLPTLTASRRSGLQSHGKNVMLGSLNPTWCEWFMGVPIGWSESEPLAT